jgi:integrase
MQSGSLTQVTRQAGPAVWQFRWSEKGHDGRRVYRKRVIGTVDQYANLEAARSAVTGLLSEVNSRSGVAKSTNITIEQLCDHFQHREMLQENSWRTIATKKTYQGYLRKWIRPRWGKYELSGVKAIEVESWLRSLPLARSSCAKIRNVMSLLFNHACRYELFDRNPIRFVRQSAKRRTTPEVLTPAEVTVLLDNLDTRERTLVLIAAGTGLRQSELFGLKWSDIDFKQGTMNVTRSIVDGVVGRCKTESSQKPVPLHPFLGSALSRWRKHTPYRSPEDWVFASRLHAGRKPCWGQVILRHYVRPAAKRVNIHKRIGWHTFRHTYSTLLRSVGAEFKVMQELLRHSSSRTTLEIYTQAVTPAKHAAQAAVLSLFFPRIEKMITER